MPPLETIVHISVTEMAHFERLVQFLEAADDYAHREVDLGLKELVEDCREDLRKLCE